jgi:hypothetical protein
MNNRFFTILNTIKAKICGFKDKANTYEYECRKCGLILTTNRNQPGLRCPNDGSTMYRT